MPATTEPDELHALTGPRTSHVSRQERYLRGGGSYVASPDFAIRKDPDFWSKLDGNAVIRGASDYRRHLVAAPEAEFLPPSPRDAPLVPVVSALVAQCANLQGTIFGLADAYRRGMTVGRMFGDWEDDLDLLGDDTPRRWYVVRSIEVRDREEWQLQRAVDDEGITRYAWATWDYEANRGLGEWVLPPDEDWYLFHRYQDNSGQLHGRDLARALWYSAYALHVLDEASLDTAERFGAPWIHCQIDKEAGGFNGTGGQQKSWASIHAELGAVVKSARANNYIFTDKRLSMQLLEVGLRGADYVTNLIDKHEQRVRILILGSNLPSSATQGGSYALAYVQDETTRRLVAFDRRLMNATLTEYVRRLVEWNRPVLAEIPTNDGTGRTLADCAPPQVELADEEVLSIADREAKVRMAGAARLRIARADLHAAAGFPQPPPDARPEDVVDFGGGAGGGAGGGTLFGEHSPVWRRYAEGRLA